MATTRDAGKRMTVRGTGHRYTAEFRREALRLMDGGKSMTAVSEELGVSMGTLTQWRLKAALGATRGVEAGPAGETVTAENDRLRRENKALKQELAFAKKKKRQPSLLATTREIRVYRGGEGQFRHRDDVSSPQGEHEWLLRLGPSRQKPSRHHGRRANGASFSRVCCNLHTLWKYSRVAPAAARTAAGREKARRSSDAGAGAFRPQAYRL